MSEREKFGELLSRVGRRVTALQASEICCGDLTLEQFQTLRTIDAASEAPSLGKLSAEMGVDLSTMSRNVTVLERNEYVLRSRSAEDGRVVTVKLTAKGRHALETLCCDEDETFQKVYEQIPVAGRTKVVKALEVLEGCLSSSDSSSSSSSSEASCCSPVPSRSARGKRAS